MNERNVYPTVLPVMSVPLSLGIEGAVPGIICDIKFNVQFLFIPIDQQIGKKM